SDDPDTFEWTNEDGERVSSTYFHGKVKSKVDGKTHTDSIDSNEWRAFKVRKGVEVLVVEEAIVNG
ncbi:MAG: hypothetical protein KAI64_01495, partial [Thermoplasmata archaeon]|nr:hypothetical protein [Thermoplasmata archaeon]